MAIPNYRGPLAPGVRQDPAPHTQHMAHVLAHSVAYWMVQSLFSYVNGLLQELCPISTKPTEPRMARAE
jgi:hypothetical protein